MSKRAVIIVVITVATVASLLLGRCHRIKHPSSATPQSPVAPQIAKAKPIDGAPLAVPERVAPQAPSIASIFSAEITFFGLVQDQEGSPIAGAEVRASVADKFGGGSSKLVTQSDQQGKFKITSRGMTVSVRVAKAGYFAIPELDGSGQRSVGAFDYGADVGSGIHKPDEKAPVVFTLYKPGTVEPLNRIREKEVPVPRNGEAVTVPLDTPSRQLLLNCWTNDGEKERDGRYDWRLKVSVTGGGLLPRMDEFAFSAPPLSSE